MLRASRQPQDQLALLPVESHAFPSTRYQGSKAKLAEWIWQQIAPLDFDSCLDAFGGTGAIAYRLKQAGKAVTYNDVLRFNYEIGLALIANSSVTLTDERVDQLLARQEGVAYRTVVQDNFHDIYFTDEENRWIDQTITNVRQLSDPYARALAFFALCQSCIIKRPYNLFHRKNLYVRFAEVERTFGNKTSWDRPFEEWFRVFVREANQAVFSNGRTNAACNLDAAHVPGSYDLVYIDTPYLPASGVGVDYRDFYHFLEGLTLYDDWPQLIDRKSKHGRLAALPGDWTHKKRIYGAFERLFEHFRDSILVVSYRGDGIPSEAELVALLQRHKRDVRVERFGQYKYALSTNGNSSEILLIAQ